MMEINNSTLKGEIISNFKSELNDTDDDEMRVLSLTVISEHVDSVVLPRTRQFLLLLTYISRQT